MAVAFYLLTNICIYNSKYDCITGPIRASYVRANRESGIACDCKLMLSLRDLEVYSQLDDNPLLISGKCRKLIKERPSHKKVDIFIITRKFGKLCLFWKMCIDAVRLLR